MFSGCIHLLSIPDISKWDVSKVIDVSYLFYDFKELKSLPDALNLTIAPLKSIFF